jgi:hypothetical protein
MESGTNNGWTTVVGKKQQYRNKFSIPKVTDTSSSVSSEKVVVDYKIEKIIIKRNGTTKTY